MVREARRRGLVDDEGTLGPREAFRLVRDLPYRRTPALTPEAVVAAWCGTCTAKHVLLKQLLGEMGIPSRLIMAGHLFSRETAPFLPPEVLAHVDGGPVPDVHTYLEVLDGRLPRPVDATWPLGLRAWGFPANPSWEGPMALACVPLETGAVPEGCDVSSFKEAWIVRWVGRERPRREALLQALRTWLDRQEPSMGGDEGPHGAEPVPGGP